MPFADLISSTSYFDRELVNAFELAAARGIGPLVNDFFCFGQLSVCGPGTVSGVGLDANLSRGLTERFVQEFRLLSNSDGPLQWTLGAYYKDDDSQTGPRAPCDNCGWVLGFFPDVPVEDQALITQWLNGLTFSAGLPVSLLSYKEQAIYGEVSYDLSDQWEILLGLRLAEVEHALAVGTTGIDSAVDPLVSLAKQSDIVAPKVTLTWRPIEDWMAGWSPDGPPNAYATYSEGFRPGLINTALVTKLALLGEAINDPDTPAEIRALAQAEIDRHSGFRTTESDFVENYELGIKATVLGGRLSFTGALYRIAYEDIPVLTRPSFAPGLPGSLSVDYTVNVGSAESKGLELEVRLALTDNLLLTFGGDKSFRAHLNSAPEGAGVCPTYDECRAVRARSSWYNARRSNAQCPRVQLLRVACL